MSDSAQTYYDALKKGDFGGAKFYLLNEKNINLPKVTADSSKDMLFGEFFRVWFSEGWSASLDRLDDDKRIKISAFYKQTYDDFIKRSGANMNTIAGVMLRQEFLKKYPMMDLFEKNYNLLLAAIKYEQIAMAKILIDTGANVNFDAARFAKTPLHEAVEVDSLELVKLLLAKGASVNAGLRGCLNSGATPIFWAKSAAIIKVLINAGAEVNCFDDLGSVPIHKLHNLETVKALVKAGADVHVTNCSGRNTLMIAKAKGDAAIIEFLLGHGASENKVLPAGNIAAETGGCSCVIS